MHRRLNSGTKWVIFITGLLLTLAVEIKFYSDRQTAERNFIRESKQELKNSALSVANQFHLLYADLRTIARMPAIRNNPISSEVNNDDWADVRELYASMAEATPVRLVRIVPSYRQWAGPSIETPTLSKDFISGRGVEKLDRSSRQMILIKGQMERMPKTNEGWRWDVLKDYPAYSCRPFLVNPAKKDRNYLLFYSVPIFSANGYLWGCACAELPTATLKKLLPNNLRDTEIHLKNDGDGINVPGPEVVNMTGEVYKLAPEPIRINDRMGKWKLEFDVLKDALYSRPEMIAAEEFRWVAHLIVAGISIAAFFVFSSLSRRRYELEEAKESLEHRVSERTTELADALKDAKDASRTKGEFLANMSHEIRTPMNGIMAMTEMLLQTKLDEEQQDLGRTIAASAESLLTIINDVLDFSKIEARKLILEQIEFDLAGLLEDVVKLYAPAASSKNLELVADLQPSTEKVFVGDPVRIRQIVSNLLGNAIKFTDKGSVILKADVVEDLEFRLKFSVKDSGVGIPASRIDAIFESFTQSDASTTRKFGGTGLGLTICRHLAELMGGSIGVHSKLGKGSEFFVSVKIREAEEKIVVVQTEEPKPKRILVCDDFEPSLNVISRQLELMGHEVVRTGSADEILACLKKADSPKFDVLLIDYSLGDTDGLALAKHIRAKKLGHDAVVILIAAAPTGASQADLDLAGVQQTLIKPIRRDVLSRAVNSEKVLGAAIESAPQLPAATPPAQTEEVVAGSWLKLLLVEDNPVNQKVAKKLLANMGCTVTVANDGLEAVDMDLKQFDLILMDCQMPRLDGLSATRQIRHREQRTGEHSIIVALTANAMAEDRVACLEAGMDEYMAKPLRQKPLEELLQKLTGKPAAA